MMKLSHKFVDSIPDAISDGVLYISVNYATAIHKCCCGCGSEVVTPLSPTDWKLSFDGVTVSLYPSVGNWSLPCQSHYWITDSKVEWMDKWSQERIADVRKEEQLDKEKYYRKKKKWSFFDRFKS